MKFIAAHAEHDAGGLRWGVEPTCMMLSEHGCPIAPSTYYAARAAQTQPCKRAPGLPRVTRPRVSPDAHDAHDAHDAQLLATIRRAARQWTR